MLSAGGTARAEGGKLRRLTFDHGDELANDLRFRSRRRAVRGVLLVALGEKTGASELGFGNPRRNPVAQDRAYVPLLDPCAKRLLRQARGLRRLGDREAAHGIRVRPPLNRSFRSKCAPVSESEKRLARNEAIFREINERTRSLQERFGPEDPTTAFEEFLCECGDQLCVERVKLTIAEYESVRDEGTQFVVRPGHSVARIERTVLENDRYAVVIKLGDAAEVADDHDPRS
jgi:hypothetical protein